MPATSAPLLLSGLLLLLVSSIVTATLTVEVVTIQNCTCMESGCAATHPASGTCSVDPLNPANGRIITCLDQVQQCAQLINFNDAQCTVLSGVYTAVCGTCQKLNANPPYYARPNCNSVTNDVTWDTNCNVDCSKCLGNSTFVHPFSVCSPALGGNGYTYNQGVQSCDAVNVTVVSDHTCAAGATVLDAFIVGQYACNFGEYMSCTPKNPSIPPASGSTVVMSQCPWSPNSNVGVCANCPQTYFPANSCQPPPPNVYDTNVLSVDASCEATPGYCGDIVIHGNTHCSMYVGRSTPVCGSCMMLAATSGPAGTYSKIFCNMTSLAITLSHGCDSTCSTCTLPNFITHNYLQCNAGDPNGTSTYNRGIFPCNIVEYHHYSDANCSPGSLIHVEQEADAICQFDRMSQCVDRLVTFQNCTNPAASVTTMENTCVSDPVTPGMYRVYSCNNQAPQCSQLVEYSDPACTQYLDTATMVCDQCMKVFNPTNPTVEMFQSVTCDGASQAVTIRTNCDSTCGNCLNINPVTYNVGACTLTPTGHFVRNDGLIACDAVRISVYSAAGCNASTLSANFTISQDVCTFHEFVQCTADPLPTPPVGNALVYEQYSDTKCGSGTVQMSVTTLSGGCLPNYQGRPGAHVVSCDATESWCADLSIHSGTTCGPFIGTFHPVCNTCSPWFNDTDPSAFFYIACDSANPNVTVSGGCDSTCTNCQYPDMFTHPYLECTADVRLNGRSIINRGVIPCATVSVIEYSDVSCIGSSVVASWQTARDFCEMGQYTTCTQASIGIQNCSACNTQSTSAACNKTQVPEAACVADPYSSIQGGMRTVSCVPTWQQCVHLAIFTDGACNESSYRTSVQAVCNQCNQLIEVDAQGNPTVVYAKLSCNSVYGWISIQTHCNADCSLCNDTDTTLINDVCTETTFLGGVYNFGPENCDAVQISQYHTAKCTGVPISTYMVGQHQCSFGEYYECNARPMMEAVPFNGKVVQRTCPNPSDVACTNCTTQEFASGSCMFNRPKFGAKNWFGSYTVTCSSLDITATCVNMALHGDNQCLSYAGDHHPVCGACYQLPGEANFTQVLCDPTTQDVTFNKDCDPRCTTCGAQEIHKYMTCGQITNAPPQFEGKYVFNRGLMPCDTVLVQQFQSMNCAPSTLAAEWPQATSACEFGGSIQCVPHIVHIQQCSTPTAPEAAVLEGACTPDPYGMYRQYRCFDESLTCATLIMYNESTQCNPTLTSNEARPQIIAGVCGSCLKRPSMQDRNILEYFLMNCDQNQQTVWFSGGCNANCQRCTQPRMETHPFMQCSPGYMPGSSVFNQGVRPCNGVQVSVYPDNTCTGSSMSWFEGGQRDCGEFDHLYIYCDANPRIVAPDGGQVLMTMCPWQQGQGAIKRMIEGDCTTGCQTYPVVDGACAPAPPGETRFVSHRVSCDTQFVSMCADIVLFNSSTTCTPDTFMGIHTPVCGSCYQFGMDATYTQVLCNVGMEQVSFNSGCNSDCSQCSSTNQPMNILKCDPTQHVGFSMVSRGLFQCPTVTFTHYSSTDCLPGTSIGTFVVAQGVCEFNQRLQCSRNLVTVQNCSCPTCAATYSADSQCMADAFGQYRRYECGNVAQQCVNMGYFRDGTCEQYTDGFTVVCNTCWKQVDPFTGLPSYTAILCNATSQEVTSLTGCSDSSCSDCTGGSFTHPFNQCSRFMRGSSLFNTGMQACDSIDVTVYADSLCSTQSIDHWVQGQDFCALHEYVSCSAAPVVNPSSETPNNALEFYTCPVQNGAGIAYGCIGCDVSIETSGACYPSETPGQFRSTNCDSSMAFCAAFVLHNDTTCAPDVGYLGDHNPVCGTCSLWFDQTTYTQVVCDIFSKNVTVNFGCNADCSVCGSSDTHAFMQCGPLMSNPSLFLYNRGVMPCSTVSISEFTASDCAPSSIIGTYQVAQDLCQHGHKVKCFHQATPVTPGGTGASPSGLSAGAAAGVTIVVLVAVAGAVFGVFKYRQRKTYRTVDPQWSAMNEQQSPSNVQGSYGSLQNPEQ